MRTPAPSLLSFLLLVLACGPPSPPRHVHWSRSPDASEDFDRAKEQCTADATRAVASTTDCVVSPGT